MARFIIAYDLGTGGNKASLYAPDGACVAESFTPYPTLYPHAGWHEQRPEDWWQAVVRSTRDLLARAAVPPGEIGWCALSGHSLGIVPLDARGQLLLDRVPIWSDGRAVEEAAEFFRRFPEERWYGITGNGFPPPLYSVFKLMWLRRQQPELFGRIDRVIGTKDYVNYRLTGAILTDHSYASGTGVYELARWRYHPDLIGASGLPERIFPEIVPSTQLIGRLTRAAAEELGLPDTVAVAAGGVDNSCMALGARNLAEGRIYNSLGSSSWLAVCSRRPLIDFRSRPYVFAHVMPGFYNSAVAIFSAGTTLRWVRDQLCGDLAAQAAEKGVDVYDLMTGLAAEAPLGAGRLLFNPSLAGGSALDPSPRLRGGFTGLDLSHDRRHLLRAVLEGIALHLGLALAELKKLSALGGEILVVGGGSRSRLWRQILADVYGMQILKSSIDQQAAALGAAAVAAVGAGLWKDFSPVDGLHRIEDRSQPVAENREKYAALLPLYERMVRGQAEISERLAEIPL